MKKTHMTMNILLMLEGRKIVDKQKILSETANDEDRILVSRLLDKIEQSNRRNSIEYTDFLNLSQRQLMEKTIKELKIDNYIASGGYENAERTVLAIYPKKLEDLFKNNQFSLDTIFGVIRIILPNELKGIYFHRDYLGAIMKIGMKREKIGDILTCKDGADIIVLKEVEKYVIDGLKQLKRFNKTEFKLITLKELNVEEPKTKVFNIIVPSMRLDSILSEALRTSRAKALQIIKEERVFVNHEVFKKGSKEVKKDELITVRGKGRFKVGEVLNTTKKGNLIVEITKYF